MCWLSTQTALDEKRAHRPPLRRRGKCAKCAARKQSGNAGSRSQTRRARDDEDLCARLRRRGGRHVSAIHVSAAASAAAAAGGA